MNIPGVVIATTPRQAPKTTSRNAGRMTTKMSAKTSVKTSAKTVRTVRRITTKKATSTSSNGKNRIPPAPATQPPVPGIAHIPPPTPGIRGIINDKKKHQAEKPHLKYVMEWGVSSAVELKPDTRSPYKVESIIYNGVNVFIPPTININTDKYVIVDMGDDGNGRRYIMRRSDEVNKSIPSHSPSGTFKCIRMRNNGELYVETVDNTIRHKGEIVPPPPKTCLYLPQCATPRINSKSPPLMLNILDEMTK